MFRKALLLLLLIPGFCSAQIKIEGPKEGTVGYRSKAALTIDVADPKIVCFPANDDWVAVQDFAGNKYIDFVPGRRSLPDNQPRLFTFVVAGNKENKTYLATWELLVKPDGEIPVPPVPVPVPDDTIIKSELYRTLLGAYNVSPDSDGLADLTKIFELFKADVDAGKYKSHKEAHDDLKSRTTKAIQERLRPLRDAIAEYIVTSVGPKQSEWQQAKLSAAINKVHGVLKRLPK